MTLVGNLDYFTSFMISESNTIIKIYKSSFFNFHNLNGGIIMNFNSQLKIFKSKFFNNYAKNGGAIYSRNSNISFRNNLFYHNLGNYGGSLFFESDQIILNLYLEKNIFSLNKAYYGGGAFFAVYNMPLSKQNIFNHNSAKYGNNYATPPSTLSMISNKKIVNLLNNYLPSSVIPYDFIFELKDIYNNSIINDFKGKALLDFFRFTQTSNSDKNKKIFGQTLSEYSEGNLTFSSLKINMKPNSSIILSVFTDLIKPFSKNYFAYEFPNFIDSNQNYYYLIQINSQECPIGKIF